MPNTGQGPRSVQVVRALGVNSLEYRKEQYDILNTTVDFAEKSSDLASVGLAKHRELILVSEWDKQFTIQHWEKYLCTIG